MNAVAKWWDELRGGPEIRRASTIAEARTREAAELSTQNAELRRQLQQANERARLLQEFARSRVKARCAGGCGDLHFNFRLHLASDNGTPVLVPICDGCKRRAAQEQARREEALKAAAALQMESAVAAGS